MDYMMYLIINNGLHDVLNHHFSRGANASKLSSNQKQDRYLPTYFYYVCMLAVSYSAAL